LGRPRKPNRTMAAITWQVRLEPDVVKVTMSRVRRGDMKTIKLS
jgi:hypothetical protein